MAWSRFEPGFSRHPKRLKSGAVASWLWVCSIDYCMTYLTDGYIERSALPSLCPTIRGALLRHAVTALVKVGSWDPVEGGFKVRSYLEYNPSRADVEADRKANHERYERRKRRLNSADSRDAHADTPPVADEANGGVSRVSVSQSINQSVNHHRSSVSSSRRGRDSTDAIRGWESTWQAIKERPPSDQLRFRDPHVAKVVRIMGGITPMLHLNDRDTSDAAINSTRRRFLDLYDTTSKDEPGEEPGGHSHGTGVNE
jgi:hypothetical protein